jgi:hypothetical protein
MVETLNLRSLNESKKLLLPCTALWYREKFDSEEEHEKSLRRDKGVNNWSEISKSLGKQQVFAGLLARTIWTPTESDSIALGSWVDVSIYGKRNIYLLDTISGEANIISLNSQFGSKLFGLKKGDKGDYWAQKEFIYFEVCEFGSYSEAMALNLFYQKKKETTETLAGSVTA